MGPFIVRAVPRAKLQKVMNAVSTDPILLESVFKLVMMIESGYKPANIGIDSGREWEHFKIDGKEYVGHPDGRNRPENAKYRDPREKLGE